jgi:hypothetical protein
MNLNEQLLSLRNNSAKNLPKHKWDVMTQSTQLLIDKHLSNQALKVGDILPEFNLPDMNENHVSLSSYLKKGKVIVPESRYRKHN